MVLYVTVAALVQDGLRCGSARCDGRKETKAMTTRVPWVTCLCVLSLMCLPGCSLHMTSAQIRNGPETASPPAGRAVSSLLAALEGTLGQIYDQVTPSVVNIRTVQRQTVIFPVVPEIAGYPFPQ